MPSLLRHRCARCLYFRSDLWRETMRIWASAPEKSGRRIGLDRMILQVARACTDGGTVPTLKDLALAEMCRVLKPGGKLLVLEFSKVAAPLGKAYD